MTFSSTQLSARARCSFVMGLILTLPSAAFAADVTIQYTGIIVSSQDPTLASVGDTFIGLYTYDDTATGFFGAYAAVISHSVTISNGGSHSALGPADIFIGNDKDDGAGGFYDRYETLISDGSTSWSITLDDFGATAFASDALVVPNLSALSDQRLFYITTGGAMNASGTVQTLTVVPGPEPCQTDLGFQGPGTAFLSMCGEGLDLGETSTLSLTSAAPSASVYLLISLPGGLDLPAKGGTLVSITGLLPGFPIVLGTNGAGEMSFPVAGFASPLTLICQAVIADAGQPFGFAISNAVSLAFGP